MNCQHICLFIALLIEIVKSQQSLCFEEATNSKDDAKKGAEMQNEKSEMKSFTSLGTLLESVTKLFTKLVIQKI